MGCVYSRKDINDIHPRMFRVSNVDDQGCELTPGKIEVGDAELVLYQKGKEPIRWPWRCLRRYGFDAELFSFESGRRCPLGPGIYAFKCKRAERLFLLVQECIHRAGQDDQSHTTQNVLTANTRISSRPTSVVDNHDSNGFAQLPSHQHLPMGNGSMPLYINGPAANEYVNTGINAESTVHYANGEAETSLIDFREAPRANSESSERISYAVLDLPKSTENLAEVAEGAACKMGATHSSPLKYADIEVQNLSQDQEVSMEGLPNASSANDTDVFIDEETESNAVLVNYINMTPDIVAMNPNLANPARNASRQTSPPRQPPVKEPLSKINYIQLDLKNNGSDDLINGGSALGATSQMPDSPTKRNAERESYVTIDFHKTTALQNSGRGTMEEEEGLRKTRHSSTISELS